MPIRYASDTGPEGDTLVIVIDFQNEFVRENGRLHADVAEMMKETGMLQKIPHVIRAARESKAIIVHSPVIMKSGEKFKEDKDWDPHAYGAMENLFVDGTWNCEFADEVKPQGADFVLKNRINFSAFRGTQLKDIIETKKIRRLFIMGFLSNVCVEETTREASELFPDLNIYVCRDGCAAKTKNEHFTAMGATIPLYAKVITCAEAQSILRMPKPSGEFVGLQETDNLLQRPDVEMTYRPRILALHGAQSNNEVTKLQLENLHITEDDYDIVYLRGGIEVDEVHPDLDGLVHGPFYSWFDKSDDIDVKMTKKGSTVISAVKDVVEAVRKYGPFNGIFGFSSGAVVAALASNLSSDPILQDAVNQSIQSKRFSTFNRFSTRMSVSVSGGMNQSRKSMVRGVSRKSLAREGSRFSMARGGLDSTKKGRSSRFSTRVSFRKSILGIGKNDQDVSSPLFEFVILACPASDIDELRKIAGLKEMIEPGTILVNSFHIIGIEDNFKAQSEKIATLFANRHVMYMPGGHSITRDVSLDNDLISSLGKFAKTLGVPYQKRAPLDYIQMNEVSAVHLLTRSQIALVKLERELLPEGLYNEGATIKAVLRAQPRDKPFLYNARNKDNKATTTYGDVYDFINGGKGDLRSLGINPGEVVAYAAPPGGSAIAGLAFLSIGAQTAAAPLAPSTAEPDAYDALDQFDAKHLILFDGVECPGVEAAFRRYASNGKAKIHRASPLGNEFPGLFEYINGQYDSVEGKEQLINSEEGPCLLLRTSGTTARPKGVPLSQASLITNGAIIAKSMQLVESDVCYSVMPLFHIGGISASILCTLASGSAVCCDAEPYDPSRMIDALRLSNPQPTWYSSVPTIHNATVNFLKTVASNDAKFREYGVDSNGIWKEGHSLRMIRSGAAALLGPDGEALATAYGGVPIYPTYSMSEQMPISQPPAGKGDTLTGKPGSVGVPVAASTAIVNRANLRPQPLGVEGEIAISGPTVLKHYLANPEADQKSYFQLTFPEDKNAMPYFLTGDVGLIDSDGFLSLKGRAKELIKKGGEQVSPFEVEEPLLDHPWIQTPVCFAVPSKLYGEEVGCALILSPRAPTMDDKDLLKKVTAEMRAWLKEAKTAPIKWPTKWIIVNDDQLPKTKTKKYIRIGLSTHLGLDPKNDEDDLNAAKASKTAKIDWDVIGGFRFILACYVMFMHIGSNESWGSFSNLRGWPWHVHVFFTLGGYSMASPMNPVIKKKFSYFLARIGNMYPMYVAALFFGLINLLIVCRPSTFRPEFHWDGQPDDHFLEDGSLAPLFCEGTPATPNSYWGSLFLTIFTYLFGMAVTPFWPINWWLGYYLWFSSMYYFCLACFPGMYNYFFIKIRSKVSLALKWTLGLLILNAAIITAAWFIWKDMEGYGHYDANGNSVPLEEHTDGVAQNAGVLSFYLFGPFWQLYFVCGMATAFLYDAYRPAERHTARRWGWLADLITLLMIGKSIAIIMQANPSSGEFPEEKFLRPDEANQFTDSGNANRLWDNISGRIFAPLTTLWVFALSTGEGYSAKFFRSSFLSQTLAPNAYNCFLFHQVVGQWYFAATRNGTMWNWWRFRKDFYWFSPKPCPVEWYEYFYVVGLVVGFSNIMNTVEPLIGELLSEIKALFITPQEDDDEDTGEALCGVIEGMTGIEPMMDYTLEECGLASIGVPVLVGLLNKKFSTKKLEVNISASNLVTAKTIGDMVELIEAAKNLADDQGV